MAKPEIHFIPTQHWMNDPNGFIYYKGLYHLFYQYFPYENVWGTMHWGHKVSKDLMHWEDLGIALYPSKPFDRNGVFSGSAIEVDKKMYVYYTGIVYDEYLDDDIHRSKPDKIHACQAMISSADGIHFDNHQKQIVIDTFPEGSRIGHRIHTRDPKIWKEKDTYYMVLGTLETRDNPDLAQGEILIYRSQDAIHFELANTLTHPDMGTMWECPDYFKIDGQGILTLSPIDYYKKDENHPGYTNQAIYVPVNFDAQNAKMTITGQSQLLDLGEDIYATQSNLDKDGRRTLIGWMRMPLPETDEQWIGMMSLPRVMHYKEDGLYTMPHPNIASEFSQPCGDFHAQKARKLVVDLNRGGAINIGGYHIAYNEDGCLYTDRSKVFPTDQEIRTSFKTPELPECHLEIYTDLHIIEIFINGGKYVLSNIVYDLKNDLRFENIKRFEIYQRAIEA